MNLRLPPLLPSHSHRWSSGPPLPPRLPLCRHLRHQPDPPLPRMSSKSPLLASVGPEVPPVEGSGRKVLRSRTLLESMLEEKSDPVSTLVPDPVAGVARMIRPPVLTYCIEGVREAP